MPEKIKPTRSVRRMSKALGHGVKDLPDNATWLLSKAVGPLDPRSGARGGPSAGGLLDLARSAGATVMDALPGPDSIDLRLQRARAAVADAQEAEERAVEESLEAEREAQEAEQVAERCREYVRDVEAEQERAVEVRVDEARREADARVEATRREAQADAEQVVESARQEAEGRAEEARKGAEAAHERARVRLDDARDKLLEARQLSEEAIEATRAAAEEAHRQALQVAADAEREARGAEERVDEAERVRARASSAAGDLTNQLNGAGSSSGLKEMTKQELLGLAAAQDVEGRSAMTKDQLVSALTRTARKTAKRATKATAQR
jgi:colicin import membrane protein